MRITKKRSVFYFAVVFGVLGVMLMGGAVHAQVIGGTLPSVPQGLNASVASTPTQVNVSWSASTESSGTIEGYYIYRNGAQIAITAGTSMVDGDLTPGFYGYTVAAYDANGNVSRKVVFRPGDACGRHHTADASRQPGRFGDDIDRLRVRSDDNHHIVERFVR